LGHSLKGEMKGRQNVVVVYLVEVKATQDFEDLGIGGEMHLEGGFPPPNLKHYK